MVDLYQASSLKGSTNTGTMISSPLKSHTNEHTICGRPILNVFERFMKGGGEQWLVACVMLEL